MKTPRFWHKKGVLSTALLPLAALYHIAHRYRVGAIIPKALSVPVICVGNLTAGGAGKTPVVIALLEHMLEQGIKAQCISRGYGGSTLGPVRVDPKTHTAEEVGDEPLLIAKHGPCWVAKRRLTAATAAVLESAELIIMDDGLQNPTIKKDMSFLIIDGGYGFGNGRTLPAGPLRETLREGLKKVDAVILIGEDTTAVQQLLPPDLPILHARLEAREVPQGKVVAFAGIGRPEKFFTTLRESGAEVVKAVAFADHHPYTEAELEALIKQANAHQAQLMTTEKDAVRVPEAYRKNVQVLPVSLVFEDTTALEACLAPALAKINAVK